MNLIFYITIRTHPFSLGCFWFWLVHPAVVDARNSGPPHDLREADQGGAESHAEFGKSLSDSGFMSQHGLKWFVMKINSCKIRIGGQNTYRAMY